MTHGCLMTAEEISEQLGISKGHAYKLIRQMNEELHQSGFVTVAGKIPRAYWQKKFYGYDSELQMLNEKES